MNLYHFALILTLTATLSPALGQTTSTTPRTTTTATAPHTTATVRLTSATVAALTTEDDWTDFWTKLGSGAQVDITTTIPLSRAMQETAKATLGRVMLKDTLLKDAAARLDEKPYVQVMHLILSDNELYVLGYLYLANHAWGRNPRVGRAMYNFLPYDEKAWDQIPDETKLMVLFHKKLYDRSRELAVKMQKSDSLADHIKEYAMAMELASRLALGDKTICEKALAVKPENLKNEAARQLIIEVQKACEFEKKN